MKNDSALKLSVGYPCASRVSFFDSIFPYLGRIGEVYFGLPHFATGRAAFANDPGFDQRVMESDLLKFTEKGIRLNLLLNGNCYGGKAISKALEDEVCETVRRYSEELSISAITTASPFIAYVVKSRFPRLDVRASVNTWIDGIGGMQQCADIFDSFYVKRDYNYCTNEIRREYAWCRENRKKLYLLANSGCIPNCAYHTFHDNMIAHSKHLVSEGDAPTFEPYVCRKLISDPRNRYLLLAGNLVRPEDVSSYAGLVDGIKLATRIHPFPAILIRAYAKGEWEGDLTALTEPGFGDITGVSPLQNSKIPKEFWQRKTECLRARNHGSTAYCKECGYCSELYRKIGEGSPKG